MVFTRLDAEAADVEYAGLVTELNTLHANVNQYNSGNDTGVCVSAEVKRSPCTQDQSATNEVKVAYPYFFTYFPTKDAVSAPAIPHSPKMPITSLLA